MLIYDIGIYLYILAIFLATPFSRKARQMWKGRYESYRILRHSVQKGERYIMFHAASLGEFEQGRPMMERLRREHPEYKILLTFFSPSGYEVRRNYEGADIVCYLPFDTWPGIVDFFHVVKPEAVFLIKYEFWYNFLLMCHIKKIPVYSVSSIFRKSQVYFRWYGYPYAWALKFVTHFFVQDRESAEMLSRKGIRGNVTIVGDTRFDRVVDICHAAKHLPLVEAFANASKAPILVAGSTWPPDEDLIADHLSRHPNLRLILAPHVVSDAHLNQIESKLQCPSVRYTKATEENVREARVLIIDCYGLLSSIYKYAQVAYVGGGFGVGIHNVPEAAVWGVPVIIGPKNEKFREAQALLALGGCLEVRNQEEYDKTLNNLLSNKKALKRASNACRHYIHSNAGATDAIFHILENQLA